MSRTRALASFALLFLAAAGCAWRSAGSSPTETRPADGQAAAAASKSGTDANAGKEEEARQKALKRATLGRDLPIAKERLAKANRDLADDASSSQAALEKARRELELAEAKLRDLEEREAPSRLAKARLDLQTARDHLDEAKEELEQLELMYKEQDLADKTKEIVIRRGKRRVDRAQERLALQERDLQTLEQTTLPRERARLQLDAQDRRRDLEKAERVSATSALDRRIAVLAAESEIARLEGEIASMDKTASK